MRMRIGLAVFAMLVTLLPSDATAQKRQRDRIQRDEILASPHRDLDLFQVIRTMRPHFLEGARGVRTMGGGSRPPAPLAVYIDRKKDIGVEALRTLPASQVQEVRYLDPTRSLNEFGPMVNGGAIIVTLYKSRSDTNSTDAVKPPSR